MPDTPPRAVRAAELRARIEQFARPLPPRADECACGGRLAPTREMADGYLGVRLHIVAALLAERDGVRALLKQVEWAGGYDAGACPICGYDSHVPDCALAALLGAEGEGGDVETEP